MPESILYSGLEPDDLSEEAPDWLVNMIDHTGYAELEAQVYIGYGSDETRTDPADPGELIFTLYHLVPGADRVEIEPDWITRKRYEQIGANFWDELTQRASDEYADRGDYLYEQWKERDL